MKKISIVVPIYKVLDYIDKNIKSLLNQTYKNIEIILIDDGSPDDCGKICDQYALKDERIKVIHKENGGLSDARNFGIEAASGDYITFIDGDDYVSPHYCEVLYDLICKYEADISICMYKPFFKDESCSEQIVSNTIEMDGVSALENLYTHDKEVALAMHVAWGKLYKKSLFDIIKYPKGKINEDEFVIHYLYGLADKIILNKSVLYYYLQRNSSIMGQAFSEKRLDCLEALKDRIDFFEKKNLKDLKFETCKQYNYFIRNNYYLIKEKTLRKKLKAKYLPISYFSGYFSLKNYVSYYMFKYCPSAFKLFIRK